MRTIRSSKRGCGYRSKGGTYLVSEGSPGGILPLWVSTTSPVPCEDRLHRGPVLVNGEAILARRTEEEWFVGSSADHREKLRADEWSLARFGMTTTMRLRIGECADLAGVDKAMEHLLSGVRWSPVHLRDAILNLTKTQVTELPRVAEDFATFVENIQCFEETTKAENLVYAAAAIWRIADKISPSQRTVVIPHLMRILVILGLNKDGLALRKRYLL